MLKISIVNDFSWQKVVSEVQNSIIIIAIQSSVSGISSNKISNINV